jgi:hypothetical protein
MESLDDRLVEAWKNAAHDLSIEFKTPFILREGEREVCCAGLLPHFGSPKGTVLASRNDPDDALDLADTLGYYAPGLNPDYYETYDRARFVAALLDWGWHGPPEARPAWLRDRP